jgi:UMF1 family MFS transporter
MLSYFFYIDGVNTVIHMATVYGSSLGLGSTGMILALLITQLVAVPCSIIFSRLAEKFGSIRMLYMRLLFIFSSAYRLLYGLLNRTAITRNDDYDQALKVSTMLFWAMALSCWNSAGRNSSALKIVFW